MPSAIILLHEYLIINLLQCHPSVMQWTKPNDNGPCPVYQLHGNMSLFCITVAAVELTHGTLFGTNLEL